MRPSMQLLVRPIAVGILGWLLAVSAVKAQDRPSSPGLTEPSPAIPDQKLEAAAAAMEQVVSLKEDYRKRMETAPASDKERIADEANNALVKAVTDRGLSVDEYTSILIVAQKDPEVGQKILQRIRPPAK